MNADYKIIEIKAHRAAPPHENITWTYYTLKRSDGARVDIELDHHEKDNRRPYSMFQDTGIKERGCRYTLTDEGDYQPVVMAPDTYLLASKDGTKKKFTVDKKTMTARMEDQP